ncbi:NAD-P-binding protein [Flammula alnicola]|nr:NAD-P-binding protein [Flammula alnicola]
MAPSPEIPKTTREYRLHKLTGFQDLQLETGPVPHPKEGEVLVKVYAVSLNFRDLIIAKGGSPLPTKPSVIPGSDCAAKVILTGSPTSKFKPGDRVSPNFALDHVYGPPTEATKATCLSGEIDGVLGEYRVFPEHSLVLIPDYLSYEEASTLPCAALTAYNALTGSGQPLKAGDTVLVQSTGGVAIFAIQIAHASGATVIATSSSDAKLEIARALGTKHTINYKTNSDWEKEVLKLTGGEGVDHVVEIGGPATWLKSLDALKYGGYLHVIGAQAGLADIRTIVIPIIQKSLNLHGVQVGSRTQFEALNRLLTASQIHPVIDKVFEFEQAREAYEYLSQHGHVGKVIIRVSKDGV